MQMRTVLLATWVTLAGAAFADPPAGAPGKPLRYVMVLKARAAGIDEPDVAPVGGRELSRWRTRRVIEIPRAALDALSRHTGVHYLALVNDGTLTGAPKYVRHVRVTCSTTAADADPR